MLLILLSFWDIPNPVSDKFITTLKTLLTKDILCYVLHHYIFIFYFKVVTEASSLDILKKEKCQIMSFINTFLSNMLLSTRTSLFLRYYGLYSLHYWTMCHILHFCMVVLCCIRNSCILFAGYSFVTGVFPRESKICKLDYGNYLAHSWMLHLHLQIEM